MRNREILCAGMGLALLVAACGDDDSTDAGSDAGSDAGGDTSDTRFDAFEAALQADLAASEAYGVSAAVMENGVVTFAAAFGAKDPDGADPLTPDTLMQIGSTTKQMTAAALLQKVAEGLLTTDDTLEELLPELEFARDGTWDDQITVHHLLSHQGGQMDWTLGSTSSDDAQLADFAYGAFAAQEYLMNPPGAFWNYSNPNFSMVGLVTESLDTRPWPDIVEEDLFAPLGMTRTFARKAEVEADGDYALSYGLGLDDLSTGVMGPVSMEQMPDPAFDRPAGFLWTTPTQMMAWAKFLMEGDPSVLSDDLRSEITTAQVDTLYGAGSMSYGYGMFVETGYEALDGTWYEMPVWEHGGNTLSFSHVFYLLPEQGFAVAICSSGDGTDFMTSLDVALTTLADLPAPSQGPEYSIDPAEFDRHLGAYFDEYNIGDVTIARDGDALLIDAPTLAEYGIDVTEELVAISSDLFLVTIDDGSGPTQLDLTFIPREGEERSTYIRNRSFVATRVEDEQDGGAAAAPRAMPSREDVERWVANARRESEQGPLRFDRAKRR